MLPPPWAPVFSWEDWGEHCLCSCSLQNLSKGYEVPFDVFKSPCCGLSCRYVKEQEWVMLLRLDQAWYPPCRVINTGPRAGSKPLKRDCHMSTSVPLRDESPFTNTLHANLFCTYFFLINQMMQITLKSSFLSEHHLLWNIMTNLKHWYISHWREF